jgi:pyruvate/2-oxoglutarate/acetoin dehydrogenase E1 component
VRYLESLNQALHHLMHNDNKVIVLGEDILDPYGGAFKVTKGLSTLFPDRVITTPISEAAITGFSTGLAIRGFKPILEIMFGDFITLIADQIINGASKFQWMYSGDISIPMVIRTPMGGRRGYGPTHSQTLESLFFSIPGINIVAPSNFHKPGELLKKAVLISECPTIFIENKLLYPTQLKTSNKNRKIDDYYYTEIQNTDKNFPSISLILENDMKPDITLIVYGGMAPIASEAVLKVFMEDETVVEIIIASLVKPFPLADVLPSVRKSGRAIIVEESIVTAGWGAELSSQITENIFNDLKRPIARVGAKESPIPSSKTQEMDVLPQVSDIVKNIKKLLL